MVIEGTTSAPENSFIKIYRKTTAPDPYYYYQLRNEKTSITTTYPYFYSNRDFASVWSLYIENQSDWRYKPTGADPDDFPPRVSYIRSLEDYQLNSHLYFYSFTIDADSSSIGNKEQLSTNILYGINSTLGREIIAENIPIDTEYIIPEENHLDPSTVYRNLYLEFPTPIELEENNRIYLQ